MDTIPIIVNIHLTIVYLCCTRKKHHTPPPRNNRQRFIAKQKRRHNTIKKDRADSLIYPIFTDFPCGYSHMVWY